MADPQKTDPERSPSRGGSTCNCSRLHVSMMSSHIQWRSRSRRLPPRVVGGTPRDKMGSRSGASSRCATAPAERRRPEGLSPPSKVPLSVASALNPGSRGRRRQSPATQPVWFISYSQPAVRRIQTGAPLLYSKCFVGLLPGEGSAVSLAHTNAAIFVCTSAGSLRRSSGMVVLFPILGCRLGLRKRLIANGCTNVLGC